MRIFVLLLFLGFMANCQNTNVETEQPVSTQQESVTDQRPPEPTQEELNHLMGRFDPAKDSNFVLIEIQYADRKGRYLHRETYAAFIRMYEAAKQDGVDLKIISATRNFTVQKSIWEGKWSGARKVGGEDLSVTIPDPRERALKILEYSSMPGTSRHHWGTDIDLNNLNNSYFESGNGLKVYNWLTAHASTFGFCQPYSPKDSLRPNGYNEEKWHWSYLPLAKPLTEKAKYYLRNEMISGFQGAESAPLIDVVQNYVLGINSDCFK